MKLKALALAGFTVFTPMTAAAQPVSDAEITTASARFCASHPVPTECLQHLSGKDYATVARTVVENRCKSLASEAAGLARKGEVKAAFSKRLDAADCAYGILRVTEDQALQNEAQAFGIRQRAAAARLQQRP